MTIRANRPEVVNRMHHVDTTDLRQWPKVMHVDVPLGHLTVNRAKRETTYHTACAVMKQALRPRPCVSLVCVHENFSHCALREHRLPGDLLWKKGPKTRHVHKVQHS